MQVPDQMRIPPIMPPKHVREFVRRRGGYSKLSPSSKKIMGRLAKKSRGGAPYQRPAPPMPPRIPPAIPAAAGPGKGAMIVHPGAGPRKQTSPIMKTRKIGNRSLPKTPPYFPSQSPFDPKVIRSNNPYAKGIPRMGASKGAKMSSRLAKGKWMGRLAKYGGRFSRPLGLAIGAGAGLYGAVKMWQNSSATDGKAVGNLGAPSSQPPQNAPMGPAPSLMPDRAVEMRQRKPKKKMSPSKKVQKAVTQRAQQQTGGGGGGGGGGGKASGYNLSGLQMAGLVAGGGIASLALKSLFGGGGGSSETKNYNYRYGYPYSGPYY